MVNVTEFKTLLVHLFALSILWSHFQNAEKWEDSGSELQGHRLNFEAFKLACRTFDSANAHEDLTDEQIKTDFQLIDSNLSGSVGFIEVLYCPI
jgi:alanine racemase